MLPSQELNINQGIMFWSWNYFEWTIKKIFSETVLYVYLCFWERNILMIVALHHKIPSLFKKVLHVNLVFLSGWGLSHFAFDVKALCWRVVTFITWLSPFYWRCGLSLSSLHFGFILLLIVFCIAQIFYKRKSQLLYKSGIAFIKIMPSLFAISCSISFNLTPSFVINAKMKETFLAGTVDNLTSTVWTS